MTAAGIFAAVREAAGRADRPALVWARREWAARELLTAAERLADELTRGRARPPW
ncbi:hypothetical protein [Streptomyces litchfieldiae]|uniref:Uncharacterized protein n=1 Tax=Streptomyces litchfieldiae TaxID=3075543 RepID=A0ABU2MK72_9ACTN|nr:hypothetical protein [Streptomyces sp. DSM 44938]MDT0341079.1 hypothetical protein [Streptomyces sp. DSM 44938]